MSKANENEAPKTAAAVTAAPTYTKGQLMRSKRFMAQRDLLNTLLEDNKRYTMAEVEAAMDKYLKGRVR